MSERPRLRRLLVLSGLLLASLIAAPLAFAAAPTYAPPLPRTVADRPDEVAGPQVHVVYMLPSDGVDQALDTNGSLTNSISAMQRWMFEQTGWRGFRMDTYQQALDITFFRAPNPASFYYNDADKLEQALLAAGFSEPDTKYAVYYGGAFDAYCGVAKTPGRHALMFPVGHAAFCGRQVGFARPGARPGQFELVMTHELLHTLGVVPSCAPHEWEAGHVNDAPNDIIAARLQDPFFGSHVLDYGRDDYFRHGNLSCWDVDRSPYLAPSAPTRFAADFNADGKDEIAVWRPSNGVWYVLGGAITQWGDVNDVPVPGDYDADPAEDVAVWRPSTGTWWIQGSSPVQWGFAGDIPVPGDYDGNGKDEIAVWRPSTGYWYVQGSPGLQWGATNDIPLAGDFDADPGEDITAWRPESGTWYVQGSAGVQWGASGDIP